MYRSNGNQVLGMFLKNPKNIEVIEGVIFDISKQDVNVYNEIIMHVVESIQNKEKLSDIVMDIQNGLYSWNSRSFASISNIQKDEDEFIKNPFEVEEGALTCFKCGSKRTISFTKQQRSADEPASTIAKCIACKNSWVYNG